MPNDGAYDIPLESANRQRVGRNYTDKIDSYNNAEVGGDSRCRAPIKREEILWNEMRRSRRGLSGGQSFSLFSLIIYVCSFKRQRRSVVVLLLDFAYKLPAATLKIVRTIKSDDTVAVHIPFHPAAR